MGELALVGDHSTVPLTRISCNTFFSKSQNKAVTLCTVDLEDFEEGKASQLWKKGELDAEGYFTLENSEVSMVLTAISGSLAVKRNITLR